MGDMPGGQFDIPRDVIKAVRQQFRRHGARDHPEATFCCGGGGGLLTDDLLELRVKGAMPRMQALKQVVEENGVTHMAAICAICKAQFTKVLPYYKYQMDMIAACMDSSARQSGSRRKDILSSQLNATTRRSVRWQLPLTRPKRSQGHTWRRSKTAITLGAG